MAIISLNIPARALRALAALHGKSDGSAAENAAFIKQMLVQKLMDDAVDFEADQDANVARASKRREAQREISIS